MKLSFVSLPINEKRVNLIVDTYSLYYLTWNMQFLLMRFYIVVWSVRLLLGVLQFHY